MGGEFSSACFCCNNCRYFPIVLSSDCVGVVASAVTVGGDGDLTCMLEVVVAVITGLSE